MNRDISPNIIFIWPISTWKDAKITFVSLGKGMATHSSLLAWRISWTEDPSGLYSPWGHNESDPTEWITLALVNRKAQVKNTIKCHFPTTRMAIIKIGMASSAGGDVEKWGTPISLVGIWNSAATLESSLALSQTVQHTVILRPINSTPRSIFKRNENICPHKKVETNPNVHLRWMYTQNVAYPHNELLLSHRRKHQGLWPHGWTLKTSF